MRVRVRVSAGGRRVEVVQRALVVRLAHAQHGARLERVRVATLEGESAADHARRGGEVALVVEQSRHRDARRHGVRPLVQRA